jgi:hypothetical protein
MLLRLVERFGRSFPSLDTASQAREPDSPSGLPSVATSCRKRQHRCFATAPHELQLCVLETDNAAEINAQVDQDGCIEIRHDSLVARRQAFVRKGRRCRGEK